jgi:hypothetical protein
MKKILKARFLSLLLFLALISSSCSVNEGINEFEDFSKADHYLMIMSLKVEIDNVLIGSKPVNLPLAEYKIKLVNGELDISSVDKVSILTHTKKLERYGRHLALKNNIQLEDLSASLALGGFLPPDTDINHRTKGQKDLILKMELTNVLKCAAVALGADAIFALGGSSAAWSAAAITRAFSAVAKRFLGPIGVAIAVVSFGICLAESAY